MPTYRLTNTAWLAREVERAKGVLQVNMEPGREYTAEELRQLVRDFGLDYDTDTLNRIGQALITDGTLEEVP